MTCGILCAASSETAARVGLAITTSDDVIIGQSFTVVATVTNKTSEDHVYGVRVRGRAMLYTGITGQVVKSVTERVHVTANQCEACVFMLCEG